MCDEVVLRKYKRNLFRIEFGRVLDGSEAREFMQSVNAVPWVRESRAKVLAIAKRYSLVAKVSFLAKRRAA